MGHVVAGKAVCTKDMTCWKRPCVPPQPGLRFEAT